MSTAIKNNLIKNNIAPVLIVCILFACDDTFTYRKYIPMFYFESQKTRITSDSVKTSLKVGKENYPFDLIGVTSKQSDFSQVTFSIAGTNNISGTLYRDNVALKNNLGNINSEKATALLFAPSTRPTDGVVRLIFTGTDNFDSTGSQELKLFLFSNLLPVAKFVIEKNNLFGQYSYNFNATTSYDKDAKWGGAVRTYKYTITSNRYGVKDFLNSSVITPVVFSGPENYTVTLVVYDNDGEPSIPVRLIVTVL